MRLKSKPSDYGLSMLLTSPGLHDETVESRTTEGTSAGTDGVQLVDSCTVSEDVHISTTPTFIRLGYLGHQVPANAAKPNPPFSDQSGLKVHW